MKKLILLLIALLFASAMAIAVEGDGATDLDTTNLDDGVTDGDVTDGGVTDGDVTDGNPNLDVDENDNKIGDSLIEKETKEKYVVRRAISRIHLVGNGIAISEADAFDFLHARVVIGAVKVKRTAADVTAEEANEVESAFIARRLGVLMLDKRKYKLRDIAVSHDEISAEIYGPAVSTDAQSGSVGEIDVKRFEKPGRDIWAGNMVLDGKTYNIYLLGIKRKFKLKEVASKIGEYCSRNPEDSRCRKVVEKCRDNAEECKNRVTNYCESNSSDRKCLQLKKLYCLKNAADERCREYLKGLCEKHPRLKHCRIRSVDGERVIGINIDAVSEVTPESGEASTTLVVKKPRRRLNIVKRHIRSVRAGAGTTGESENVTTESEG